MEFSDLADMVGNGVAKATLLKEMYQERRRLRISTYMHQFDDYAIVRRNYSQTYRRMHDSRPLAAFPTDLGHGGIIDAPRSSSARVAISLSGLFHPAMKFPTCDYQMPPLTGCPVSRPVVNPPCFPSITPPVNRSILNAPCAPISFDDI